MRIVFLLLIFNFIGSKDEIYDNKAFGVLQSPYCAVVCCEMMVDRKHQYCFCRDKKLCSDNIDGCKEICGKRKRCDNCFKKSVVTIIYVG